MPKAILIENVPGLVSLGQGTVVKAIYSELERMGYKTKHKILYAAHYGVPQMRFRTIFISTRIDSEITFPEPNIIQMEGGILRAQEIYALMFFRFSLLILKADVCLGCNF